MLRSRLLVVLVLLLASMLFVACGPSVEPEVVVDRELEKVVTQVVEIERAAEKVIPEVVVVEKEVEKVVTQVVEVESAAPAPRGTASPALASAGASDSGLSLQPRAQRMIIKDAEVELLVADTDVALDSVTVLAADYGGYIVSSHIWFEDDFKYATLRLGVPVLEFENVLRRLRGLALKVTSEVASGEDVTDQYVDLQSRLTNLQATRDRIRVFLEKAETVDEALKVNEQLSEVEGQIEEIQGWLNYLKDRAAYSTINVQLNPELPTPTPSPTPTLTPTPTSTPTPTPTPTPVPVVWRPGETAKSASGLLTSLVRGLIDTLIWVVIVLGPLLVIVAIIVALILWWRRRRARQTQPPEATENSE